jgi:hypothetical protein
MCLRQLDLRNGVASLTMVTCMHAINLHAFGGLRTPKLGEKNAKQAEFCLLVDCRSREYYAVFTKSILGSFQSAAALNAYDRISIVLAVFPRHSWSISGNHRPLSEPYDFCRHGVTDLFIPSTAMPLWPSLRSFDRHDARLGRVGAAAI